MRPRLENSSLFKAGQCAAGIGICFLALVCFFTSAALAQEDESPPKDFFKKNFANEMQGPEAESIPGGKHAATPAPAKTPQAEAATGDEDFQDEHGEQFQEGSEKTNSTKNPLEQGEAVLAVGAILNSQDSEHYADSLKELAEVAIHFDLPVGEIITIGDMRNIQKNPRLVIQLLARGGRISVKDAAPAKYKVHMSPTWIIRTAQGEVVLEATGPLENNFNLKGQYVDRNKRFELVAGQQQAASDTGLPAAPTPLPTPVGMEEFR